MGKIKLKGIYAHALYELLLKEGYRKCMENEEELVLFSKNPNSGDTSVYDKEDKNGVIIHGSCAKEIVDVINKELTDVLTRKKEVGDIYVGFVKRIDDDKAIISLGRNVEGILDIKDVDFIKVGSKLLVQTKSVKKDVLELSTQLRLFGESMILIKNGFTKVSKHIKNINQRERLESITKELNLENWGILWKSLAEDKSRNDLIEEINDLLNQEKEIMKKFRDTDEPLLICKGFSLYMLDFGLLSKLKLDSIRSSIMTTVSSHHILKSGGYDLLTDFAESISKHTSEDVVKDILTHILRKQGPKKGYPYTIKTITLNGVEYSEKGKVLSADKVVSIKDHETVKHIKPGDWFIISEYDGMSEYKITTPIEVFPEFARCIDLGVRIRFKNDDVEVIGEDELDNALNKGYITNNLYENVKKVVKDVIENGRNEF